MRALGVAWSIARVKAEAARIMREYEAGRITEAEAVERTAALERRLDRITLRR